MVSGTKIGQGSSTELRFWRVGTDKLLELLEEEVLEDILNQVKTLKISKKLKKIRNRMLAENRTGGTRRIKNGRRTRKRGVPELT